MQPIDTKQAYGNYVNKKSPNSPILKNCLNAFWVGGLICSLGQLILSFVNTKVLMKSLWYNCFHYLNWIICTLNKFKYF